MINKDELAAELEQLEQEELDAKLLDVDPAPQRLPQSPSGVMQGMPGVPSGEPGDFIVV